mmetsp:Transcript_9227/g.17216  ORF Transcript_9227/g.17216 Transcript_9227/m.17216 type:complete len:261 (-) Transcript_9227:1106-1888(-)
MKHYKNLLYHLVFFWFFYQLNETLQKLIIPLGLLLVFLLHLLDLGLDLDELRDEVLKLRSVIWLCSPAPHYEVPQLGKLGFRQADELGSLVFQARCYRGLLGLQKREGRRAFEQLVQDHPVRVHVHLVVVVLVPVDLRRHVPVRSCLTRQPVVLGTRADVRQGLAEPEIGHLQGPRVKQVEAPFLVPVGICIAEYHQVRWLEIPVEGGGLPDCRGVEVRHPPRAVDRQLNLPAQREPKLEMKVVEQRPATRQLRHYEVGL